MMNSFHNTVKYLRMLPIKNSLKTIPERKSNFIANLSIAKPEIAANSGVLSLSPRTIGLEITDKQRLPKIKEAPIPYVPIINPRSILPLIDLEWRRDEVGLPAVRQEEVQAARLIVIRKKKMKKHQRRKLWKRMRHRWARVRQRRRQIKEKIFQNELLALIKQANEFSAEGYVADKLERANHTPLPTRWKHKRLPEFIIRQLLGIDKKINYKHTDVYKA
ncbi:uncharacterized protein LOC115446346 [Manduca sexta]|uniref:uncharacterized protein LOC115446346 n=1 Tax=Manduca sexta TaxID=7130 RepID=UPI00188FAF2C|nr:uncharacterized protein LOC115446346 [Manduca sexta]